MSKDIDEAFLDVFIDDNSNFGFGDNVSHENINYKPVQGTAYAELRHLPNRVEALSLADSNETSGIFRVILRYPPNTTAVAAKTKAEEIMAAFPIGVGPSHDGTKTTITSVQRQPGVPEDGWYKLVVTIAYVAFLTR